MGRPAVRVCGAAVYAAARLCGDGLSSRLDCKRVPPGCMGLQHGACTRRQGCAAIVLAAGLTASMCRPAVRVRSAAVYVAARLCGDGRSSRLDCKHVPPGCMGLQRGVCTRRQGCVAMGVAAGLTASMCRRAAWVCSTAVYAAARLCGDGRSSRLDCKHVSLGCMGLQRGVCTRRQGCAAACL